MKKILAAALALTLCAGASAESYTLSGVCTLTFPDDYTIDDVRRDTDDEDWRFSAYNDYFELDFYLMEDYGEEDESLFNFSDEELETYIDEVCEANTGDEYSCEYLKTETIGGVPFVYTINMDEDDEVAYGCETLANGTCLYFMFYDFEDYAGGDDVLAEFTEIMSTFVPAV